MQTCLICKRFFVKKANGQKWCSVECKKIANKEYNKNWSEKNKEKRQQYKLMYRMENKEKIKEYGKKHHKKYYAKNKEAICFKSKVWYITNKNKSKFKNKRRKYKQKYDKLNKQKQILYRKNRKNIRNKTLKKYMQNPMNRITRNLRVRLSSLLVGRNKSNATLKVLGCSMTEFKQHLQKQFTKGMNWKNYGRTGWHIDHIKQCTSFDLTKLEEQKKCFHYTNLRPLWAEDNLRRPRFKLEVL